MGSERFVEIDFGTQVVNRIGGARVAAVATQCFRERGAETLEFNARAAVKASDFVEVVVEANVAEREAIALRVAQQRVDSFAGNASKWAVYDAKCVASEVFVKRYTQRAHGPRVGEEE